MTWIVIISVGLGSFLFRVAPVVLLAGRTSPGWADRLLSHASSAALATLVVSSLRQATTTDAPAVALIAVTAGAVVALRGGSMPRVVLTGVIVHIGLTLLLGSPIDPR